MGRCRLEWRGNTMISRRQFMKISTETVANAYLAGQVYPWAMLIPSGIVWPETIYVAASE